MDVVGFHAREEMSARTKEAPLPHRRIIRDIRKVTLSTVSLVDD